MWRVLVCLCLMACGGDEPTDTGRTACEESCFTTTLRPCRDNCDAACGADDQCRDMCHGDCIGEYDACVVEQCSDE